MNRGEGRHNKPCGTHLTLISCDELWALVVEVAKKPPYTRFEYYGDCKIDFYHDEEDDSYRNKILNVYTH